MKNLHDPAQAAELKRRLDTLTPASPRGWGKMTASQALAHCTAGLDMASGALKVPRMLIGRVIGRLITPLALGDDKPMRPNSPTVPALVIGGDPDFEEQRARLRSAIDAFVAGGPSRCTTHPHPFFGSLRPEQWAVLMYKHVDHHLRQFGA